MLLHLLAACYICLLHLLAQVNPVALQAQVNPTGLAQVNPVALLAQVNPVALHGSSS